MRGRFVDRPVTGTPSQRLRGLLACALRPVSSDVGGWIVIGGLAIIAIAAGLQLPQFRSSAPMEVHPVSGRIAATPAAIPAAPPTASVDFIVPDTAFPPGPEAARIWNASLPFSNDPVRSLPPLIAPVEDVEAYGRALDCLTAAVYYEAAAETARGQAAVAQVVLNRTRHPAYPRSVCGVVFQGAERSTGCQFSFTCDGAMARPPSRSGWTRARSVAERALNGAVMAEIGMATHYHTDWVAPDWATSLSKTIKIGTHIFYRWRGTWGSPSAFTAAYRGTEPVLPQMARLSTAQAMAPVYVNAVLSPPPPLPVAPGIGLTLPAPAFLSPAILPEVADVVLTTSPADPVFAPVVSRREAAVLADPLVAPSPQPIRQPRRIAAPSSR